MNEIVFLLEEPSAQAMLEGLLPRLIPSGFYFRFIVFEGKQDLQAQMVRRLRGYLVPGARFVILQDKDSNDCIKLKRDLVEKCVQAGHPHALVRIACFELECWYLADLPAVEAGLKISGLSSRQNQRICRTPDNFPSPSVTLKRLAPAYQKISGSRAIGPHLSLENGRSSSFANFVKGMRRLLEQ